VHKTVAKRANTDIKRHYERRAYGPVVEVEFAQKHAELLSVDSAAAVLVHLLEQQRHELHTRGDSKQRREVRGRVGKGRFQRWSTTAITTKEHYTPAATRYNTEGVQGSYNAYQQLLLPGGEWGLRPGLDLAVDLGAQLAGQLGHVLRVRQHLVCENGAVTISISNYKRCRSTSRRHA
jgi:hypothetical protein